MYWLFSFNGVDDCADGTMCFHKDGFGLDVSINMGNDAFVNSLACRIDNGDVCRMAVCITDTGLSQNNKYIITTYIYFLVHETFLRIKKIETI